MEKTDIGVTVPGILLPADQIDLTKWAVVACDQFTSEPDYWEKLSRFVGDAPSTYDVIFPEVYLGKDDEKRIERINCTMANYLASGVFQRPFEGFVLVSRTTKHTGRRLGLVLAVDLEKYSYRAEDKALIRATEGTILSRIPPRVKIRENAPLELPHIMLLIDDRKRQVIEPLYAAREGLEKLYDFDLNMDGGHITGWRVEQTEDVLSALEALLEPRLLREKYGAEDPFLFAVGDGNHSLATAKTCWEKVKATLSPEEQQTHPARYALVEVVNVFDEGLVFEPIHRVAFGVKEGFLAGLKKAVSGPGRGVAVTGAGDDERLALPAASADAVLRVQQYLDEAVSSGLAASVDYVHGEDSVRAIVGGRPDRCGILLPKMHKEELFRYVAEKGALPRKTFSMGEATEKRYYLEARKIVK